MRTNSYRLKPTSVVAADKLRRVAEGMLPFYRAVAASGTFAQQWSRAVEEADLSSLQNQLRTIDPLAAKQGLGTNGIGYFVTFGFPKEDVYYTNGTTIPPGTARFTFPSRLHRRVARAILPLYMEIAVNKPFAKALARAIRRQDRRAVVFMVKSRVRTQALRSIEVDSKGFALNFKYRSTKYTYQNLLFLEEF